MVAGGKRGIALDERRVEARVRRGRQVLQSGCRGGVFEQRRLELRFQEQRVAGVGAVDGGGEVVGAPGGDVVDLLQFQVQRHEVVELLLRLLARPLHLQGAEGRRRIRFDRRRRRFAGKCAARRLAGRVDAFRQHHEDEEGHGAEQRQRAAEPPCPRPQSWQGERAPWAFAAALRQRRRHRLDDELIVRRRHLGLVVR